MVTVQIHQHDGGTRTEKSTHGSALQCPVGMELSVDVLADAVGVGTICQTAWVEAWENKKLVGAKGGCAAR